MKKALITLCVLIAFSCVALGASKKLKIALVTDLSGVNDHSFNEGIYNGIKAAQAKHPDLIEMSVFESKQQEDFTTAIERFAENGINIIFTSGFMMADVTKDMATNYADTTFIIIDSTYMNDEYTHNLVSITFDETEPGYLAGVVAGGLTSKYSSAISGFNADKKIGVIKGMAIAPVDRYALGFANGVKSVCSDCEIKTSVVNSFTDQNKAEKMATDLYKSGVDIIFPIAGLAGLGVIKAAQAQKGYVVGVDNDQNYIAPNNIITSAMKKIDVAVSDTIESIVNGKLETGKNYVYSVQNNGVGIAPFHGFADKIPADLKKLVDKAAQDIKSGATKPNAKN